MGIVASVLKTFHGGIHPAGYKELAEKRAIESIPMPKRLIIPLHQHAGAPADAVVQVGQKVLKGDVLGKGSGHVSAHVHAPTSGTVVEVGEHTVIHPSGLVMLCVVLEPDGEDRWNPDLRGIENPEAATSEQIRDKVRECGIVGLGGAVYPTFIKITPPKNKQVELIIANGAECEPYLCCDARLMEERSKEVLEGLRYMMVALGAKQCVIGIEDNKPAAISAMKRAVAEVAPDMRVIALPVKYPQGGKNQMIESITGRQIPAGGRSSDTGASVHNVGTAYAVREAVRFGRPLISRLVTVSGLGMARTANLEVLIGTPVADIIAFCGGLKATTRRVVSGGPMIGDALQDLQVPVVKATSGILALTETESSQLQERNCIRCGRCVEVCPASLQPTEMAWLARNDLLDALTEYSLSSCIECGSCSYVCPSAIPLVQYFRYGKAAIWARRSEKRKLDEDKKRTQAKEERVARELAEKERKKAEMKAKAAAGRTPAKAAATTEGEASPAPAAPDGEAPPKLTAVERAARARAAKAATVEAAPKELPPAVVMEAQVAETPVVATQAVEVQVAEAQVAETAVVEAQVAETSVVEAQVAETSVVETQVAETSVVEAQVAETSVVEAQVAETSVVESPAVVIETTTETPVVAEAPMPVSAASADSVAEADRLAKIARARAAAQAARAAKAAKLVATEPESSESS